MDDKNTNAKLKQSGSYSAQPKSVFIPRSVTYNDDGIVVRAKTYPAAHVAGGLLLKNAEVLRQEIKSKITQEKQSNLTITMEDNKSEFMSVTSAGNTFAVASSIVEFPHGELESGTGKIKQSNFTNFLEVQRCESLLLCETEMAFGVPFKTTEVLHENKKSETVHKRQSFLVEKLQEQSETVHKRKSILIEKLKDQSETLHTRKSI